MTNSRVFSRSKYTAVVFATVLVCGWYFYLSYRQYRAGLFRGDFAAIWQSVYNSNAEGRPDSSFNMSVHEYWTAGTFERMAHFGPSLDEAHQFGIHAHLYTVPLGWISGFFNSPYYLLAIQALCYGGFVLFLGLRAIKNGIATIPLLLLLMHFAFSPFSLGLILNDFHFDSFAGIAVGGFALWLFVDHPAWAKLIVWAVLTVMIKESFVALIVGAGFCLTLSGKQNITRGILLIALGGILFLFLTKVFIPYYSEKHTFLFSGIYGSRLGSSLGEIIGNCIRHPMLFVDEIFLPKNMSYVLQLALCCSILAWLAPRTLLLGVGFVFINLASSSAAMKLAWGQYSAVIICSMHLAAVEGYPLGKAWANKYMGRYAGSIVIAALLFLPLWADYRYNPIKDQYWRSFMSTRDYLYIRHIPQPMRLAVDDTMANFVADRKSLYLFPMNLAYCDMVLLSGSRDAKPWYISDIIWMDANRVMNRDFSTILEGEGFRILMRKRK